MKAALIIPTCLLFITSYIGANTWQQTSQARGQHTEAADIFCPPIQENFCPNGRLTKSKKRTCTELMRAAENGNTDSVRALLRDGADVNQANPDWGITALMLAAERGHVEIVKMLLKAGANPNAVAHGHGGIPAWAWMYGMNRCNTGWLEITDAMLAAGVLLNPALAYAIEENDTVLIEALLKRGADVNFRDQESGDTLLMHATRYSRPEVVKALIDAGADLNVKNKQGKTALAIADESYSNSWRDNIVLLLKQSGAKQ